MIRLSLWLPLVLIVVCNSAGAVVGVTVWVAQQLFLYVFMYSSTPSICEFYDSICSLLRHCTLIFRQEVNSPCIKQAVLLFRDEAFLWIFCCLFSGWKNSNQKRWWYFLLSLGWVSVCSDKSLSMRMTYTCVSMCVYMYTPTKMCTHRQMLATLVHAVLCNLLSPNYSRLEPMYCLWS